MSATPPEGAPPPQRPEGTIRCARCGADVLPDHDWCLECGLAARTRVAPTPRWRVPLYGAAIVAALAVAALAVAFIDLTKDPSEAATTVGTTAPAPAVTQTLPPAVTETLPAPVPTTPTTPGGEQAPPATTTPPAATIPPATTTPPATTSPGAGSIPGTTIPGTGTTGE